MSNRTISRACEMLRKPETSLADVRNYLCPNGGNPETGNCVIREAWHIAKRLAAKPRRNVEKTQTTSKTRVKRAAKRLRADRRNVQFGRKPRGNTSPIERRAIWALRAADRAEKARAA